MCHIKLLLVPLMTVLLAVGYVNADTCPRDSPCTCEEILNSKNETFILIDCRSRNLESVPEMAPLKGLRIERIDLSNNKISSLQANAFSGLHFAQTESDTLPKLDLNGNPFSFISSIALHGITAEKISVNLSDTQFMESQMDMLRKVPNITRLYLASTEVRSVPENAFASFTKLKELDLSDNPLSNLNPDMFGGLEDTLEILHLTNVGFTQYPSEMLQNLRQIHTLYLGDNDITTLPPYLLAGFKGFSTGQDKNSLILDGNRMTNISTLAFKKRNSTARIDILGLSHTGLHYMDFLNDPCTLIFRPNASIQLNGNPLVCDCDFYSLTRTGVYQIEGTCNQPEGYAGKEIDILPDNEKEQVVYLRSIDGDGYDGLHAAVECNGNVTTWRDQSCAPWWASSSPEGPRLSIISLTVLAVVTVLASTS